MSEDEKLTTGQHRFIHEAQSRLRNALEAGKTSGRVSQDASLHLFVNPTLKDESLQGSVELRFSSGRRPRPEYLVFISPSSIGDWSVIRHEAGHVFAGHPEKGLSSSRLASTGNFPDYVVRELKADIVSRRAARNLPYLCDDLVHLIGDGIYTFGLDCKTAFDIVKTGARKLKVPYSAIKQARRQLVERGLME